MHPDISHISEFTEPSTLTTDNISNPSPMTTFDVDANGRRKPRPRRKPTTLSDPIANASVTEWTPRASHSDPSGFIDPSTSASSSIADRAKTRNRRPPARYGAAEVESVISISSESEQESSNKKFKSKSNAKTKKGLSVVPDSQNTVPLLTSSFPIPPPLSLRPGAPTSSLPPSDAAMDPDTSVMDIPPIEYLPRANSPLFTPSSSPRPQNNAHEQIPPPFFASSSGTQELEEPPPAKKKPTKKRKKNQDDEDFCADADAHQPRVKSATVKVQKKKSKQGPNGDVPTSAPPQRAKPKKKTMAKGKEANFKSSEFIASDNEVNDELDLLGDSSATSRLSNGARDAPPNPTMVVPDSEDEERLLPVIKAPRKPPAKAPTKRRIVEDEEDELEPEKSPPKKRKATAKKSKGKGKAIVRSEDEMDTADQDVMQPLPTISKENNPPEPEEPVPSQIGIASPSRHRAHVSPKSPSRRRADGASATSPSLSRTRAPSIRPVPKLTPMAALIRRVNSQPGSPFTSTPVTSRSTAYSPYLKSSKSMLSKIMPLHPNRRTPPPPPPRPPPKKKTKKELEREEKWEEELVESVGGVNEWACLTDAERKDLRRAKWDREMAGWDD